MKDRAAKYSAIKRASSARKPGPLLIAYVSRTQTGKVRLRKIGIRFEGQKEEIVADLRLDDPHLALENDYKVRKAAHEIVKKSAKFGRFYDASTRISYDSG
jgi:hypothetical protein